jgi:DNA-binding IclR family transcriptional regulator
MNRNYTDSVRTTETSLEIINLLLEYGNSTLNEIAKRQNIAPSTALRHLKTLERHGYVFKRDGEFRLGTRFMTIAGHYRTRHYGYRLTETYVEKLVEETGERAQFMIEEAGKRIFLFRRTSSDIIRNRSQLGANGLLHDTAGGKAILAEMSQDRVQSIIDEHGLPPTTEKTITDADTLFEELADIRTQGYAVSLEEAKIGYNGLGAVITDGKTEKILGSLSLSGPSHRLTEQRMHEELSEVVMNQAKEVELKMQYDETESS